MRGDADIFLGPGDQPGPRPPRVGHGPVFLYKRVCPTHPYTLHLIDIGKGSQFAPDKTLSGGIRYGMSESAPLETEQKISRANNTTL